MGEVDADLVFAARMQAHEQERGGGPVGTGRAACEDAGIGPRRLARPAHAHAPGVVAVAADGLLERPALPGDRTGHRGQVGLLHGALGHQAVERGLHRLRAREEHEPRGIPVQAVHRLELACRGRVTPERAGHGIRERARARAVAVHDHTGGLIRREQCLVPVDDETFRHGLGRRGPRGPLPRHQEIPT